MFFLESLLDLIFPPQCLFCQRFTDSCPVCPECQQKVKEEFFTPPYCQRCGKPTYYEVSKCSFCRRQKLNFKIRSLGPYWGMTKDLIVQYKMGSKKKLAHFLTQVSLEIFYDYFKGTDKVTFIPATRHSLKKRGFNPAKLLAELVSKEVDLPLVDALGYIREPAEQKNLGFKERKINIKGAFCLKNGSRSKLLNERLLLIDDILTTGFTVKEAVKVLKGEGKAKEVRVFTLVRQL